MKYKLLSVGKDNSKIPSINIGDYIQALAASQFLPSIDGFIDRDDELMNYDGCQCKMIMNGWYMHKPQNWPPSNKIIPLFVAFHINSAYTSYFGSSESLDYLKKHEPIGCRDYHTLNFLKQRNIDSYFSGCLTLTLGNKYYSKDKDDTIYFVDPYVCYSRNPLSVIGNFFKLLLSLRAILIIAKKMKPYRMNKNWLTRLYGVTCFYNQYKPIFGKDVLKRAEYIAHIDRNYRMYCSNEEELLKEAERLVILYSKAKLVVTSRIHCALPCLGLNTNVFFVENKNIDKSNESRLKGLTALFNIIESNKGHLSFPHGIPNIYDTPNPVEWKNYAEELTKKCRDFVNKEL